MPDGDHPFHRRRQDLGANRSTFAVAFYFRRDGRAAGGSQGRLRGLGHLWFACPRKAQTDRRVPLHRRRSDVDEAGVVRDADVRAEVDCAAGRYVALSARIVRRGRFPRDFQHRWRSDVDRAGPRPRLCRRRARLRIRQRRGTAGRIGAGRLHPHRRPQAQGRPPGGPFCDSASRSSGPLGHRPASGD